MISHQVGFARLADRVIVLNQGKIAETGIHEELREKKGVYAEFFGDQAMWYVSSKGGESNEE